MSKNKSFVKFVIVMAFMAVFFVLMNISESVNPLKNTVYNLTRPITRFFWQSSNAVAGSFSGVLTRKEASKEIEDLITANRDLMTQLARLSEVQKENEVLRDAFDLGINKEFDLAFGQVVGKDYSADSVLVDAGVDAGIKKGDPVITSQKLLVGRVGNVYDNFSEVILITNAKSSFDVIVLKGVDESGNLKEGIYSIVKGQGGFKAYVDFVPKEKEILKGDIIETAALGQIFPQGIVVGTIKEVKNSDVDPFQIAELDLGFTMQSLDRLFIIRNQQ